jgi:tRNA (guanosine-2'-O-)-methyltransferase
VHVIPGPHGFLAAHKVARGAHRWLDVLLHADSERCLRALKERGYRVVVAVMGGELRPEDLRSIERVAVVFGNEHAGASEVLRHGADATCAVPMIGFVESLNVSVAAAITLYGASLGRPGDLSEAQRKELTARFLVSTVRDAAPIVREYAASR